MTDQDLNDRMDDLLRVMSDWYQDERQHFIETHSEEIERKASELEITCDYYIAEFI